MLSEQRGSVRWLWLNRAHRRNALNPGLIAALDEHLAAAMNDTDTGAVVIAGLGPSFCSGADLAYLQELVNADGDPRNFLTAIQACFARIEQAPKPVIAALHGHVVAGGLELALACDVLVARTGTLIGDGHVRNGLLPGGGASVRLPRKIGEPLARWMILTGELLPAERFVHSGFVHSVTAELDFHSAVTTVAEQLLHSATPHAHRRGKALLRQLHDAPSDDPYARELDVFAEHWQDNDIAAALSRFLNKRKGGAQ